MSEALQREMRAIPERVASAHRDGYSMRDIAAGTGLSLAGIHKVIHGGNPRLSTLLALLQWLDVVESNASALERPSSIVDLLGALQRSVDAARADRQQQADR